MEILDRRTVDVIRAPLRRSHYRAMLGMLRRYPESVRNARRYVTGWGEYPYGCRIRTPVGIIAPTLYSWHDMLTATEVFCREDYRAPERCQVIVDIGSNIGLSALYFLTENRGSKIHLFEPDPRNVVRLRANLATYRDRYTLAEAAITHHNGETSFGIEPSGRYGVLTSKRGIGNPRSPPNELITVPTRALNDVLEEILDHEQEIDVLKVDSEGTEIDLVTSIRGDLLNRIRNIFYESASPQPLHEDRYRFRFSYPMNRLRRRS